MITIKRETTATREITPLHCVAVGERGNGARCTPPPVSPWDVEDKREGAKGPPRLWSPLFALAVVRLLTACPSPCSSSWVVDVSGRPGGCAWCRGGRVDVVDTRGVDVAVKMWPLSTWWRRSCGWCGPDPHSPAKGRDVATSLGGIRGVDVAASFVWLCSPCPHLPAKGREVAASMGGFAGCRRGRRQRGRVDVAASFVWLCGRAHISQPRGGAWPRRWGGLAACRRGYCRRGRVDVAASFV